MPVTSLTQLNSAVKRHNFFRMACRRMEPNVHLFYFCVEAYRAEPSEKKAIFIYDSFVAGGNAELESGWTNADPSEAYNLLRPVNVYDLASVTNPGTKQITGVAETVANTKLIKTFIGKIKHKDLVTAHKHPRPDLFDELQGQVHQLVKQDWLAGFDADKPGPAVHAKYTRPIQLASVAMEKVGFKPDSLGVY